MKYKNKELIFGTLVYVVSGLILIHLTNVGVSYDAFPIVLLFMMSLVGVVTTLGVRWGWFPTEEEMHQSIVEERLKQREIQREIDKYRY